MIRAKYWSRALPLACDVVYFCLIAVLLLQGGSFILDQAKPTAQFAYVKGDSYLFCDFLHFYGAGEIARSQMRFKPYDLDVQRREYNHFFDNYKFDKPFYTPYVPFVFPLCVPLTYLSVWQAFDVCLVAQVFIGIAALVALGVGLKTTTKTSCLLMLTAYFASWPFVLSLRIGQPALILTALIALYALCFFKKRDVAAGVLLAFSSFKIQYTPFFLIPALAGKRFRLVTACAVTEAFLLALAGATIGFDNIWKYPSVVLAVSTAKNVDGFHPANMICLRGLLSNLGLGDWAFRLSFGLLLVPFVICAVLWYRLLKQPRVSPAEFGWLFAVTTISAMVFAPHTYMYDSCLFVIPVVLTVSAFHTRGLVAAGSPVKVVWVALLMLYPLFTWFSLTPILNHDASTSRDIAVTLYEAAVLVAGFTQAWLLTKTLEHELVKDNGRTRPSGSLPGE